MSAPPLTARRSTSPVVSLPGTVSLVSAYADPALTNPQRSRVKSSRQSDQSITPSPHTSTRRLTPQVQGQFAGYTGAVRSYGTPRSRMSPTLVASPARGSSTRSIFPRGSLRASPRAASASAAMFSKATFKQPRLQSRRQTPYPVSPPEKSIAQMPVSRTYSPAQSQLSQQPIWPAVFHETGSRQAAYPYTRPPTATNDQQKVSKCTPDSNFHLTIF